MNILKKFTNFLPTERERTKAVLPEPRIIDSLELLAVSGGPEVGNDPEPNPT